MELLREIGLEDRVYEAMPPIEMWKYFRSSSIDQTPALPFSPQPARSHRGARRYGTSLLGEEIAAVDHCDNADGAAENIRRHSPSFVAHLSQPVLEDLLMRAARRPPAHAPAPTFLHELELSGLVGGGARTEAVFRGAKGGAEVRVRAEWVVGADGARSRARELCGIASEGGRGLERFHSVHFRCPALLERLAGRGAMLFFTFNAASSACVVAHDLRKGEWVAQVRPSPPFA